MTQQPLNPLSEHPSTMLVNHALVARGTGEESIINFVSA
jgi:hypothetical protein